MGGKSHLCAIGENAIGENAGCLAGGISYPSEQILNLDMGIPVFVLMDGMKYNVRDLILDFYQLKKKVESLSDKL